MKKILVIGLVTMLAASLSACTPAGKKSFLRVKCPACGYEFEAPAK